MLALLGELKEEFDMWGKFCASFVVSAALTFGACQAGTTNQAAVPSGNAAGVHNAISWQGSHLLWIVGGGVVVGGVVLVATGNGHGAVGSSCPLTGCTSTTTTTTTTKTSTSTTSTATTTTKTN
jgi:hypothetical protein